MTQRVARHSFFSSNPLHRQACGRVLAFSACMLLSACGSDQFLKQYEALASISTAVSSIYCKEPVKALKAEQLHGSWTLTLTQANLSGQMRLSRHPEFSESLRGNLRYGPVEAIASGDLTSGKFELDESSDGKRLTATWSGQLTESACGDEIRGTWTELDTNRTSDFVLVRVKPAAAPTNRAGAPIPAGRTNSRGDSINNNFPREDVDDLPNGVRVDAVPDPGLN